MRKSLAFGIVVASLLTVGTTALAQSTYTSTSSASSSSTNSALPCGALTMMCIRGTQAQCIGNHWQCLRTSSSASSSSVRDCGADDLRCRDGFTAQCGDGGWRCEMNSKSSSSSVSSADKCLARCTDGYAYHTCTRDGHPINYFSDPCMNHSSSSVMSCKTPTMLLCIPGLTQVCRDGEWVCASTSSSSQSNVHLTSLTPESGITWTKVTITGTGFAHRNNAVQFADSVIPHLRSRDGTHISFRVPRQTFLACFFTHVRCLAPVRHYGPGPYNVSVNVNGDVSNTLVFTVK